MCLACHNQLSMTTSRKYRAAVLTVSDSVSQGRAEDRAGPAAILLIQSPSIDVVASQTVSDDVDLIRHTVSSWIESYDQDPIHLILTTGGTGFGPRDVTPEVLVPKFRPASGLVHLLLTSSIAHTPMAALSRPVAGTCKKTLLITLPGSVKAVTENVNALLSDGILLHALDLIAGHSGDLVHRKLQGGDDVANNDSHHNHSHHHHRHDEPEPKTRIMMSNDPAGPVTRRKRQSPYPIISLQDAMLHIRQQVTRLEALDCMVGGDLQGCVLAEDAISDEDIPPCSTTNVDGYALRATSILPGTYKVLTPQSHHLSSSLPDDCIYRINTGAPLPTGADAVVMVEDTSLKTTSKSSNGVEEELEVDVLAAVCKGENVRMPGSDVKRGECVLRSGTVIKGGGGEIGTLVSIGRRKVKVVRKPVIALLSTGDELFDIHDEKVPSFGGVYDSNRPSLESLLGGFGYKTIDLGIATDDGTDLTARLIKGLEQADLILTTGGSSMGSSDLLKPVIESCLGATIHFGRVSVKPGKPTIFATANLNGREKVIFGLPGNPASAIVTFYLFVLPSLRIMGGWPQESWQLPRVSVKIAAEMRLDSRPEFHRVVIRRRGDQLVAYSTGGQRSSRVGSLTGANGLVHLPSSKDVGSGVVGSGTILDAVVIGDILPEANS